MTANIYSSCVCVCAPKTLLTDDDEDESINQINPSIHHSFESVIHSFVVVEATQMAWTVTTA